VKLRVGILLWLISWMPIPVIFGIEGNARVATWCVQIVVGLVGLAVAGAAFAELARTAGWRRAIPLAAKVAWTGNIPDAAA
jgi:hypothetical protein